MRASSALSRRRVHRRAARTGFSARAQGRVAQRHRATGKFRAQPREARLGTRLFQTFCRSPPFHAAGNPQRHQPRQETPGGHHYHHPEGCRPVSQTRPSRPADLFPARRNPNRQRRQRLSGLRPQNLLSLKMDTLIYWPARALIALIQALPLALVARLGRAGGGLAFWLDARHRRVALKNLAMCFGREKTPEEIRALARENFRRIGENFASAVKTAAMTFDELRPHIEFANIERLQPPRRIVVAIGHFGNFELYARFHQFSPGYQCATTYRALKQPLFNQLMQQLRERSGCLYFERRSDGPLLRTAMSRPGIILGLLADQSTRGLRGPVLGHDCSTTLAPAIFALRYHCELYSAFCFRTGPARWRIELGEPVPTHENGKPRPAEEIMRDVNRAFET